MKSAIIASTLVVSSHAASLGDRLQAGIWDQAPMPLSVDDALAAGWTPIAKEGGCSDVFGYRYRLGDRLTPTLMYDALGMIAGMQIAVDVETFPLYPSTNLQDKFVMSLDDFGDEGHAAMVLHFSDPTMLCDASKNDTSQPDDDTSIGDRLWMRSSTESNEDESFWAIPLVLDEEELTTSGYSAGGCAASGFAFPGSPGMGVHWWWNLALDTPCVESGPLFLLYGADDVLTAFGFTFVGTDMLIPTVDSVRPVSVGGHWVEPENSTELWEFAQQPLYPFFFDEDAMPTCLQNLNTFDDSQPDGDITTGTLHVFVSDPYSIECAAN